MLQGEWNTVKLFTTSAFHKRPLAFIAAINTDTTPGIFISPHLLFIASTAPRFLPDTVFSPRAARQNEN